LSTPFRLQVPRALVEDMVAQAVAELPNECCGLLAGLVADAGSIRVGRVLRHYPLVNAAASPTAYLSDSRSLFDAHKDMRRLGTDLLAVYHSHPTSEPVPSRTDLAENLYPEAVHLIISLQTAEPKIRGWWLVGSDYQESAWDCI
jgi:proteasome lid subunit RPN8/RPN11